MRRLIHFFGLRRSGNHAIINWIQKNIDSVEDEALSIHYNDIYVPLYTNPLRVLEPKDVKVAAPYNNITILLSYEDIPLTEVAKLPTIAGQDEIIENAEKYRILVLRDPFNFFASRLQRVRTLESKGITTNIIQQQSLTEIVKLWKDYAKEFLGRTTLLGDKVAINYNRWVSEKEYRDAILNEAFGRTENLDLGINDVSSHGGGSSFDQLNFDSRGKEMDTGNRWKYFIHDEVFTSLFRDKELVALSIEIFGHLSGTEVFFFWRF